MQAQCFAAAVIAIVGASMSTGFAQQPGTPARPTFAPDGVVHVPAFDLPPSDFLSPEALALQKGRSEGGAPATATAPTNDIAVARAALDRYMEPQIAQSRARYPVDITEGEIAGVKTRTFMPKAGEANKSRVLINLHGGGFDRCAYACAMLESIPIAGVGRFKVISVDYREAPEHTFPAASEDVAAVYQALLKSYRPENIGIYGCSAGGALSTQVAAWFADKGLPMPGALGVFGAGGARFGAGDSAYVAAYIDGSFPPPNKNAAPGGYFRGADMNSALISPAGHLDVMAKFPPTIVITGTRAMDMSPALYTHNQLLKVGVRSELIVGEGMGHCYIYKSDLPEARDAYDIIVRFFNDHLGAKPRHTRD